MSARLAEAVLRDERAVLPAAAYYPDYQVTLSLVSVLGAAGVQQMHHPRMSEDEQNALRRSVEALQAAAQRCRDATLNLRSPHTGRGNADPEPPQRTPTPSRSPDQPRARRNGQEQLTVGDRECHVTSGILVQEVIHA